MGKKMKLVFLLIFIVIQLSAGNRVSMCDMRMDSGSKIDTIYWVGAEEFLPYLESQIKANSNKKKIKKQDALYYDRMKRFYETNVTMENDTLKCLFKDETELVACEFLEGGIAKGWCYKYVGLKNDSWLVYVVEYGSGIHLFHAYVFKNRKDGLLELSGYAIGSLGSGYRINIDDTNVLSVYTKTEPEERVFQQKL